MMNNKTDYIKSVSIEKTTSILAALKLMDRYHIKLLLVFDNGRFHSLLSIGDIQRAIIAAIPLDSAVERILRKKINVASTLDDRESIISLMKEKRIELMPIIDSDSNLVDVIFWEDIFGPQSQKRTLFNLPVVIMAGGQGTRLRPLTNVLPKPLIPIGGQTMLEDIMDRFAECGCSEFYISVNYKADFIKYYFDFIGQSRYQINYFQEDKPLGTAGSLHLLKDVINTTFFVSNCDSIVDEDYSQILDYHQQIGNEITVVSAMKYYSIPYGTLETGENGLLKSIQEKPDLAIKINTGFYILEPHLLKEIPINQFYHITYLIDKLTREGRKVGVFPISESSWIDIGNWDEYLSYILRYENSEKTR